MFAVKFRVVSCPCLRGPHEGEEEGEEEDKEEGEEESLFLSAPLPLQCTPTHFYTLN